MTLIKKEFTAKTWFECLSYAKRFIDEYNLDLKNLNLSKENELFKCVIEYGLGVRK